LLLRADDLADPSVAGERLVEAGLERAEARPERAAALLGGEHAEDALAADRLAGPRGHALAAFGEFAVRSLIAHDQAPERRVRVGVLVALERRRETAQRRPRERAGVGIARERAEDALLAVRRRPDDPVRGHRHLADLGDALVHLRGLALVEERAEALAALH